MGDWRRIVHYPRSVLALTAATVAVGLLSSTVGSGALPTASLPAFGVTNGNGSLSTVAELGDVNGDGYNDYAIGLPAADVGGSADAGMVYVFLGHAGALAPTPTSLNLANASFRISGHAGEMLGYTVVGNDVNDDGLADIAIGAPMAGAPSKSGGGAVYVVFGRQSPQDISTTTLSFAGYTNSSTDPVAPSPYGSRYDGFMVDSHTGMALAALPDVNGDGYKDLAVGASDAGLHRPGGGGVAVLYGKPQGVHVTLNDLWSDGYPYFFHVDYPTLDDQHLGVSIASVGDMTGDGQPDIAIGAPQADPGGRANAGSVWIISAHLPAIDAGCSGLNIDPTCPWVRIDRLTAAQGYRIDGATPGEGIGSSLAGVGDQNGDGIRDLAIGASGASPNGAGSGEVLVVPGQSNATTRDLAVTAPLQTINGPETGAALGASLAAAGDVDGDGRADILAGAPGEQSSAGAAYLVRGAPNTTSDLALAASKIAPAGAGSMTGSTVAAGQSLDGTGADSLVAAPGANGTGGWFVVGGSGTPVLPPAGGTPTPPSPPPAPPAPPTPPPSPPTPPVSPPATPTAAPATPPAAPVTTPTTVPAVVTTPATTPAVAQPAVKKAKKKLPLCPLKKPKAKYRIIKGKRVQVKPAPCRVRAKKAT